MAAFILSFSPLSRQPSRTCEYVQQKIQGEERRLRPKDLMVFTARKSERQNFFLSSLDPSQNRPPVGRRFFSCGPLGFYLRPANVDHRPWPEFLQPLSDIPVLRGLVLPAQGYKGMATLRSAFEMPAGIAKTIGACLKPVLSADRASYAALAGLENGLRASVRVM